jgi:hypothetical protein
MQTCVTHFLRDSQRVCINPDVTSQSVFVDYYTAGLSNAAPVIYFLGALFYSAGFNVNQNLKEKIFLNNSMFTFFSYHSHEHGLPAFEILFSFVPILLPPNPTLSFFTLIMLSTIFF